MKSLFTKCFTALLALMMLCVCVGCNNTADPGLVTEATTTKATLPDVTVARPTNTAQEVDENCPFIGTWTVTAQALTANEMTFKADGTVSMTTAMGSIGGLFTYTDTELVISTDSKELKGTYVVEGNVITVTTANDVITLTVPAEVTAETTAA